MSRERILCALSYYPVALCAPVYQDVKELPAMETKAALPDVWYDAPRFSAQDSPPPQPPPVYHEIAESPVIGRAQDTNDWNLPSNVVRTVV